MSLKDELYKLYWKDKLTQREIGEKYGKSAGWVYIQMRRYNIPTRNNWDTKTRFLNYVKIPKNPNDCWGWNGNKNRKGYGRFKYNKETMQAHRVSYILYKEDFDRKLLCLHKCDNPSCVNPNHLYLGTNADNMKDMIQKGRSKGAEGESNGGGKLTKKDVKKIKDMLTQGISQYQIGKLFGVAQSTISDIKRGHSWKKENTNAENHSRIC